MGGEYCSPCEGEAGELEGEGDATVQELGNGGGSGGAPVWWGTAPKGAGDEILRDGRLNERRKKHQRERKGEEGRFFTGDERYQ
jgi:hypothetical protein